MRLHTPVRDKMAGSEWKLRDALHEFSYRVLDVVHLRKEYDNNVWNDTRTAFAASFPKLASCTGMTQKKAARGA